MIKKTALAALAAAAFTTASFADENKHFDGTYLGADIGLSDGGEFYYGANLGYRKQTDNNMVFGVEGTFGDYAVEESFLGLSAKVSHTWSTTGYVGWVFGEDKRNLFKVGAGYYSFNVSHTIVNSTFSDSEGDFTAFVGYERALDKGMLLRTQVNYITLGDSEGLQSTIGLGYQF